MRRSSTPRLDGDRMILFHVQHLLGTGHLHRIALIAREIAARGARVCIVSGGMPVRDLDAGGAAVRQLEPVRSRDGDFSNLVDARGEPVDDSLFERRRRHLENIVDELRPRAVVVESWPFGRRPFGAEVIAMLERARVLEPSLVAVCSVRDVLQRRSAKRRGETVEALGRHFDHLLVHGDPRWIPLSASFESFGEIESLATYTGYVCRMPSRPCRGERGDGIVVAAGGGAAGMALYRSAIAAARSRPPPHRWRILVGAGVDEVSFTDLVALGEDAAIVERNRTDFVELLSRAAVYVGQAGYNTVTDLLATATPAVLVPFEGCGETEQVDRAAVLSTSPMFEVLREAELDPRALAARVTDLVARAPRDDSGAGVGVDLDGARRSAELLLEWSSRFR